MHALLFWLVAAGSFLNGEFSVAYGSIVTGAAVNQAAADAYSASPSGGDGGGLDIPLIVGASGGAGVVVVGAAAWLWRRSRRHRSRVLSIHPSRRPHPAFQPNEEDNYDGGQYSDKSPYSPGGPVPGGNAAGWGAGYSAFLSGAPVAQMPMWGAQLPYRGSLPPQRGFASPPRGYYASPQRGLGSPPRGYASPPRAARVQPGMAPLPPGARPPQGWSPPRRPGGGRSGFNAPRRVAPQGMDGYEYDGR